ncbi:MAG: FAD-dependent oxidoreductase [Candidatus Magasanikbacteria bacterium]|nr:FAD-dependent oxidoreductase [Candidatus Magasanikbacteria bacterium]
MKSIHTDILILGAGIGGYQAFRKLSRGLKKYGIKKTITIIDKNNYFTFYPLLHEVATGVVEPEHCTVALRELVAGGPHAFVKAVVKHIDVERKLVYLDCDQIECDAISYDYCISSLGTGVNFFNTPGAAEYAHHIKTLEHAITFRQALINRFDTVDKHITVAVVGGGMTGIEIGSHIAHFLNFDLKKLYPEKTSSIKIIEKNKELVEFLPPKARRLIARRLHKLGVEVILNTGVREIKPDSVILSDGREMESDLTMWSIGVLNAADKILPADWCERGCIPVNEFLQTKKNKFFYAIGDMMLWVNPKTGKPIPQMGEAAHREADYAAKHLVNTLREKMTKPFSFESLGTMMPIGENYGLFVKNNFVVGGFLAWWLRRTVYVFFMPGMIRKIKIIVDWTLRLFGFADIVSMKIYTPTKK